MFFKAKLACSFYRSMLVILTCLSISSQPLEYKGVKSSLRNCNSTMMNVLGNFTNGNCSGFQTSPTTNMPNGTKKESQSVSILPYDFYYYTLYYSIVSLGTENDKGRKQNWKGYNYLKNTRRPSTFRAKALRFLLLTLNLHWHRPFKKTKLLTFLYRLNHDNIHMHHYIVYWNGFLRIFNWCDQHLAYILANISYSVG